MKAYYNVAIIGRNGYVGRELISLVQKHPHLELLDLCNIAVTGHD